jgi:methionine-rich copper-binding protein CopC
MSRSILCFAAAMASGLLFAAPVQAHPRLVASSPANGTTVSNVNTVRLQFSETLVPAFCRAELIMTGISGMENHRPTKLVVRNAVLKDGHTMVVTSPTRLQPGRYRLDWHAVSTDTHRVDGQVNFAVR